MSGISIYWSVVIYYKKNNHDVRIMREEEEEEEEDIRFSFRFLLFFLHKLYNSYLFFFLVKNNG